ncbi:GNAT family N-acetyltransferase [uncultured Modestobacter sp.]|uniref:GNAT family N-acetyltransferase n=1 Tax=uncultured Modestobacter sp. TaxID=380048 RepID=UPI0026285BA7|nr:GNAT family N-acetyltransferase [uncultured Modestobacter sp.]
MLSDEAVTRAVEQFWSSSGQLDRLDGGLLVRHQAAPTHPLGTFLCRVRVQTVAELDTLVGDVSDLLAGPAARVLVDPATAPFVEAELTVLDWLLETQLQLVLPATEALAHPGDGLGWEFVVVRTDDHWAAVVELFRLDHVEEDRRLGRPARQPGATAEAVALRRALGEEVEYLLAQQDGRPIGCIASWVGEEGVGLIEDVFVHPDHRGRRVATALLGLAVGRVRARGAGPVLIGAEPGDTPKKLYATLGFRPTAVTRSWSPPT